MGKTLKNALVVVACLAVTALGIFMALPRKSGFQRGVEHRRPHACEACGCTFMELPTEGAVKCPNCGEEAVRAKLFVCGKCNAEFEAYRLRVYYVPVEPPDGGEPLLGAYFKRPGGRWVRRLEELGEIACPSCGNTDRATMSEKTYSKGSGSAPTAK